MTTVRAFLSRAEAAEYVQSHGLPRARGTLPKYATTGGGPRYHKFGQRCVYRREDLDAWMAARLGRSVTTTSSDGETAADGRDREGVPEYVSDTRDPAALREPDR